MKKAIITSALTISFLIGCSFTKKDAEQNGPKEEALNLTLADKIRSSDKSSIEQALKNTTPSDLNVLNSSGETLLDIAINRGSLDIINLLLTSGASPFFPSSSGKSFYNSINERLNFPIDGTNSPLNLHITAMSRAALLISQGKIENLITDINEYRIACDGALSYLQKMDDHAPFLRVLKDAKTCKSSTGTTFFITTFPPIFDKFVESKFKNSISEIVDLIKLSSNGDANITIYPLNSEGEFRVHPILIIKALREINPTQADMAINELKQVISQNETILSLEWRDKVSHKKIEKVMATAIDELDPLISQTLLESLKAHYQFDETEENTGEL